MAVLCDINWLIALCAGGHSHHLTAKSWLDAGGGDDGLVLCRISQLSFLRLLTNPAVMREDVCTTDNAWRVLDTMMSDSRFAYRDEPSGLTRQLRAFTKGYPFSPKLWQDAYLAAFAVAGKLQLVTFDVGFRKFEDLNCILLEPKC